MDRRTERQEIEQENVFAHIENHIQRDIHRGRRENCVLPDRLLFSRNSTDTIREEKDESFTV